MSTTDQYKREAIRFAIDVCKNRAENGLYFSTCFGSLETEVDQILDGELYPPLEHFRSLPSTEPQERAVVRFLCEKALAHGFRPVIVRDDEGDSEKVDTIQKAVDEATARELAYIEFRDHFGVEFTAVYIGGNGYECIADYSYPMRISSVIDDIGEHMSEFIDARMVI